MTVRSVLQLATQDRLQDGGATLHGHIQHTAVTSTNKLPHSVRVRHANNTR